MTDSPDRDGQDNQHDAVPVPSDEFSALKSLLLSEEQSQLQEVVHRLDDPEVRARELGQILPEAISTRSSQDNELVPALLRTVEDTIKLSVEQNPLTLVDSLFPVMGPAIRKSTAEFVKGIIQSFNRALENSFSWQGLRWRFEAMRTGRPFAEVVLLHGLVFRVEQVFLVHSETGLLLAHVTAESVVFQDADMVSGMLTAIQDFVRDSFKTSSREGLDSLQIGDLTVLVEQGPLAYLAAVVRGSPPSDLNIVLRVHLERVHLSFARALKFFDGDAAPFLRTAEVLTGCLKSRLKDEEKKTFPFLTVILLLAALGLGLWAWLHLRAESHWHNYLRKLNGQKGIIVVSEGKQHGKYVVCGLRDPLAVDPLSLIDGTGIDQREVVGRWESFQAMEPEFILARARRILDPPESINLCLVGDVLAARGSAPYQWAMDSRRLARVVSGVKKYDDSELTITYETVLETVRRQLAPPSTVSLALDNGILTARGVAPYTWIGNARTFVRFLPGIKEYRDNELGLDYNWALGRIKQELLPPDTVSLRIENGILKASGRAPHLWIVESEKTARSFPEISGYQVAEVQDTDRMRFFQLADSISKTVVGFDRNATNIAPAREKVVSDLAAAALSLQATAGLLDIGFRIRVEGYADSMGPEVENLVLSKKRADMVASYLMSRGVRAGNLEVVGLGASAPVVQGSSEKERALNRRVGFAVTVENHTPDKGGQ